MGSIASITMGQSPNSANYTNNPKDIVLVQGNADLKMGKINSRVWTKEITKMAHTGNIIMTVRAPVGYLAIANVDAVIGRGVTAIDGNKFLYYTLQTKLINNTWKKLSSGSTFESVSSKDIKNIVINLPKTSEEMLISKIMDLVYQLLSLQQRKLEQLKQLKKAMLQQIFVENKNDTIPNIRFKGFTNNWKQHKLSEIGKATGGTSLETYFDEKGQYKVISIGSYSENHTYNEQGLRIVKNDKTRKRLLNKNDLTMILNDKTVSGKIIGSVLIIPSDNTYVYNQRTERIEPNHQLYSSPFLYQYLNAPNIRQKIVSNAQGNTQIYVNWSSIMKLKYYLPKLDEQIKIEQSLSKLDKLHFLQQTQISHLKNLKTFLLQKLFI